MIRALINKKEIDEAYAVFSQSVTSGGEQVQSIVGYPGGSESAMLTWHSNLQFWVMLAPDRLENRYWCAYGTEDPTKQSMVSITCEINPPHFGVNRLCAGLFISDSSGSVYLALSGKVGGGRAGIGKAALRESESRPRKNFTEA